MTERKEAWMRIVILLVTGIILGLWKIAVEVVVLLHWFIVVFSGKRNKDLSEFCMLWGVQVFSFYRYMTFHTNVRPFPFTDLRKVKDKFENK